MSRRVAVLVAIAAFVLGTLFGRFVWPTMEALYYLSRSAPIVIAQEDKSHDEPPPLSGGRQDFHRLLERLSALGTPEGVLGQTFCPTFQKDRCRTAECRRNLAQYEALRQASPEAAQFDNAVSKMAEAIQAAINKESGDPLEAAAEEVCASVSCTKCGENGQKPCPLLCLVCENAPRDSQTDEDNDADTVEVAERMTPWRYTCPAYCAYCGGTGGNKPPCPIDCVDCGKEEKK